MAEAIKLPQNGRCNRKDLMHKDDTKKSWCTTTCCAANF